MTPNHPEKSVDLPPRGARNADPITDAPGSHPIETGIGAAAVGAAGLLAAAAVTGPVGAGIAAAVAAVGGGLAGKSVGEYIDPTTDDNWLRDNYKTRPYVRQGDTFETHVPAYRYGAEAEAACCNEPYDTVAERLESGWVPADRGDLAWDRAHGAVRDAYERCAIIRKQRAAQS